MLSHMLIITIVGCKGRQNDPHIQINHLTPTAFPSLTNYLILLCKRHQEETLSGLR